MVDFRPVSDEPWDPVQQPLRHREAMLRAGVRAAGFQRLLTGGHEPHAIERQGLDRVDDRKQMPEMRRVETAPEDPEAHASVRGRCRRRGRGLRRTRRRRWSVRGGCGRRLCRLTDALTYEAHLGITWIVLPKRRALILRVFTITDGPVRLHHTQLCRARRRARGPLGEDVLEIDDAAVV